MGKKSHTYYSATIRCFEHLQTDLVYIYVCIMFNRRQSVSCKSSTWKHTSLVNLRTPVWGQHVMRGLYVLCVCAGSFSQFVFMCVGRLQGVSLFKGMSACNACPHEAICVCKECKVCVCVCVCVCNEGVQRELWLFSPPAVRVLWLCGPQGKRPVFSVWERTFCPLIAALLQPHSFLLFF